MDSNQSAKRDFDPNLVQNQDHDNVPSASEEDVVSAKRFKGEVKTLKIESVNSPQNQDDDINNTTTNDGDSTNIESFQEELHPLRIGSVLENIFSNLDVDSIKNARQVNPLWSIEGAKMLITKCYLKIPSNLQVEEESCNSKEMDEFKAFLSLKSSDRSMITQIIIDKAGDAELWKSLGVLGPKIESLKLKYIEVKDDWLHILLDHLPNLKYLRFAARDNRSLWIKSSSTIIKTLTSVMSSADKDQSPLVISFMNLRLVNVKQLTEFEKFADCNKILIEELKCDIDSDELFEVPGLGIRVSNLIVKLIAKSRNILKSLTLKDFAPFLPDLEFPCMPALTYLELRFENEPDDPLQPIKFSPSFQFSEKVPNLSHVYFTVLDMDEYSDDFFGQLFEQTGTAPSVKVLEFNQDFEEHDIDPLLKTFPNIEVCKASRIKPSPKILESFWKYGGNLRKLTIEVEDGDLDLMDNLADWDSFITGFTRDTAYQIKKTPNLDPCTLEELEQLRVNPSILNLKDLEHFTIRFQHLKQNDVPERFLAVAGDYAFKLMPKDPEIFILLEMFEFTDEGNPFDEVSKHPNVTVLFDGEDWGFYESEENWSDWSDEFGEGSSDESEEENDW